MKNMIPINMASYTLSDMKDDLTRALQDCLKKMDKTDSDTGKVTLTIQITKDIVPVTNEMKYRDATVPRFRWKAKSIVPLKDSFNGEFGGDWELARIDGSYGLKSISGQSEMYCVKDENP